MKGLVSFRESLMPLVDPWEGVERAVAGRRWVWPMVLLALAVSASGASFAVRFNAAPQVVRAVEKEGKMATTTEQDLETQAQTTQRVALVGAVAKGLLGMPLALLLLAVALKTTGWLISRPAPFAACLSAAAVAMLPIVLYHVVYMAVALRPGALGQTEAEGLVPSSLASVRHAAAGTLRALKALDLFNLWSAALLGLGVAASSKVSRPKGLGVGLLLYGLYACIFLVGIPGMTGGQT